MVIEAFVFWIVVGLNVALGLLLIPKRTRPLVVKFFESLKD